MGICFEFVGGVQLRTVHKSITALILPQCYSRLSLCSDSVGNFIAQKNLGWLPWTNVYVNSLEGNKHGVLKFNVLEFISMILVRLCFCHILSHVWPLR